MTIEHLEKIKSILKQERNYLSDKGYLFSIIKDENDMTHIKGAIISHAIKSNWSRRKLYALLDEIVLECKTENEFPERTYNILTNILDALDGNIATELIITLNHDPSDLHELSSYVRSLKWMDQDYYHR